MQQDLHTTDYDTGLAIDTAIRLWLSIQRPKAPAKRQVNGD